MQTREISLGSRLISRNLWHEVLMAMVMAGALWAAAARIPVPGTVIPITLQTLIAMLGALMLRPRVAVSGVLAYIAMGACGLPVFAGGASTAALVGPSAGYIFGYIPGVLISAWMQQRSRGVQLAVRCSMSFSAAVVGCIGVQYACGVIVQAAVLHLPLGAVAMSSLIFLPIDCGKALLATSIAVMCNPWCSGRTR